MANRQTEDRYLEIQLKTIPDILILLNSVQPPSRPPTTGTTGTDKFPPFFSNNVFSKFILDPSKMTTLPDLPDDCPKYMECPISQERMEDPVVAGDHHSYDRKFIQAWFDKGNTTSPLTRAVISQHLAPNQSLKTQIKEWVDDQLRGKADMQKLDNLQVQIFRVSTSETALSLEIGRAHV